MKYPDGKLAKLGDKVLLSHGEFGKIVFSIDTNEYCSEFPKEEWEYLKKGVMIITDSGALIHYEDPSLEFIKFAEN